MKPARRFLHVCYCCDDRDAATAFFVDNFGMRATMSTPAVAADGAILGMDRAVISPTTFVYDARGPRTSPAIEVQQWIDPPLLGTPVDDPTQAGIQALGIAVADLDATTARLEKLGCRVLASGPSSNTIHDVTGVTIDLVAEPGTQHARLCHLRIACRDLAVSRRWYEGLGFEAVDTPTTDEATARLRLPDEPFEAVLVEGAHGRHTGDPNHAGLYRAALGVDDTRGSYEEMSAAGWTFDRAPMSVKLETTPVPDMWICFLSDPDGVPFEFVERPRSAFR